VLDRVSGVDDGSPLVIEGSSWGAGIKFFCVSTVSIVCRPEPIAPYFWALRKVASRRFLKQDIALDLAFEWLDESRMRVAMEFH
jgi:hypothetical protein